jgi:hypothetical protein
MAAVQLLQQALETWLQALAEALGCSPLLARLHALAGAGQEAQ